MKQTALLLAIAVLLSLFVFAGCQTTPAESSQEPAPASSEAEPASQPSNEEPASSEAEPEPASSEAEPESEPEPASSEAEPESEPEPESSDEPAESNSEPGSGADPKTVKTSKDVSIVSGDNQALEANVSGVSVNPQNGAYCAKLTDGKAASIISYDDQWFGLYYQEGKEGNTKDGEAKFVVNLGELKSIYIIRANFFLGDTSGIQAPESVKIEVSSDGKSYVSLGKQDIQAGAEGSGTTGWVGYTLEENIDAQYVRLTVKVRGVWTFLNEIEVY